MSRFSIEVERRSKPGRKAWRACVVVHGLSVIGDPQWGTHYWYGRTREDAEAKAQRWITKRERLEYRKVTADKA